MRATLYFIVEVVDDYNNYETLSNGLKVMVNNTIDSVEEINRVGKIISAPKGVKASEGDFILFHHNICRRARGFKGVKKLSPFQLKPYIYFIPVTEIFMLKSKDGGDWEALDPFVFIKPVQAQKKILPNGLEVEIDVYKDVSESVGTIAYINDYLSGKGLKEGDKIAFEEFSQHEYIINGELHYKMTTSDILGVY